MYMTPMPSTTTCPPWTMLYILIHKYMQVCNGHNTASDMAAPMIHHNLKW